MHHDTRYLLHLSNVVTHRDSSNVPGTIIEAHADQLIVSTGSEQALALLKIQQEGRKALETRAFLSGQQRWQVGTQLTNLGL